MTKTGILRQQYADNIEPRPSRFSTDYKAWAERADLWAAQQGENK